MVPAIDIRYLLLIAFFPLASAMAGAHTESETLTDPRIEEAIAFMNNFAERTGLTSEQPPRRYLWTDAFAVCNYIGLARITGEQQYMELAGGVKLSRPAAEIPLYDVVNLFMKIDDYNKCLLGMHACDGTCGLHVRWKIVSEQFEKLLNDTTIDQIV